MCSGVRHSFLGSSVLSQHTTKHAMQASLCMLQDTWSLPPPSLANRSVPSWPMSGHPSLSLPRLPAAACILQTGLKNCWHPMRLSKKDSQVATDQTSLMHCQNCPLSPHASSLADIMAMNSASLIMESWSWSNSVIMSCSQRKHIAKAAATGRAVTGSTHMQTSNLQCSHTHVRHVVMSIAQPSCCAVLTSNPPARVYNTGYYWQSPDQRQVR